MNSSAIDVIRYLVFVPHWLFFSYDFENEKNQIIRSLSPFENEILVVCLFILRMKFFRNMWRQ